MRSSGTPVDGPGDSVDRLLDSWSTAAPELDLSPVAIVARLGRLRRVIEAEMDATFAQYGLNGADFAALVTLRRLDRPGGVPQRLLMRELTLTSGTISVRVERLCARGLAQRCADPADHRNSLLALTDAGHELFENVAPAHAATENRLLAALDADQREQLIGLLRHLLVSFEGSAAEGSTPRLGLTLAPAHIAITLRRAAGLPEVLGLLVRDVEAESPAGRADIRIGDVLVSAGGQELRSVTTLHTAAKRARRTGKLRLGGIRGVRAKFHAVLDLAQHAGDNEPPVRTVSDDAVHTI